MKAAVVHPGGKIKQFACGSCFFCNHQLPGSCENSNPGHYGPEGALLKEKGGAMFGYTDLYGGYDGGQAEYARVPYADFGPRIVPENLTDEQTLFLTDIFPTGYTGIDIITHRLPLSEVEHAYHIFRHKEEDCVKVVLKP